MIRDLLIRSAAFVAVLLIAACSRDESWEGEVYSVLEISEFEADQLDESPYPDLLVAIRVQRDSEGESFPVYLPVMEEKKPTQARDLAVGDRVTFTRTSPEQIAEKWARAQRIDSISAASDLVVYGLEPERVSVAHQPELQETEEPPSQFAEGILWAGGITPTEREAMEVADFRLPADNSSVSPVDAIAQLSEQLAARKIEFLYLSIPLRSEIYPEWFAETGLQLFPEARLEYLATLAERGVQCFDAGAVLKAKKAALGDAFEPFWQASDSHLTPQGHQVIAEALARDLRERGRSIEPDPATYETQEMLLGAPGRPDLSMTVRQTIVPKTNPASPIFLAGDSNLFFYQTVVAQGCGLPSQFAAETGHLVDWKSIAGMQPHTFGQYDPGVFVGKQLVIYAHTAWLLHDARSPMMPVALK